MEEKNKDGIELEIREHSDPDFYPDKCYTSVAYII